MGRRCAVIGALVLFGGLLPGALLAAHATPAWGDLNGAAWLTTHYSAGADAVASCWYSQDNATGEGGNGAYYQFISLVPDDGSAVQYIALAAYTRTGGTVTAQADNLTLDHDTGSVPPSSDMIPLGKQNLVVSLRFSSAPLSKFKSGTLRWAAASWGDYHLYDCTLTDDGVTTPMAPLAPERVAAVPLSDFTRGASLSIEGGNAAVQGTAAAAEAHTRSSSGYVLGFLSPAGGVTGYGATGGGNPQTAHSPYVYGGGAGIIEATGPEGQHYSAAGESPYIVVSEPTNGPWTYSVDANVAHATGPVLWVAELPS